MQLSQGIMTNMWNMPHDAFRVPVQPSTDAEDVKAFWGTSRSAIPACPPGVEQPVYVCIHIYKYSHVRVCIITALSWAWCCRILALPVIS